MGASGIASERGTVGNESAQALAPASQERVQRIHDRGQPQRVERLTEQPCAVKLGQEPHGATVIAGDRRTIA